LVGFILYVVANQQVGDTPAQRAQKLLKQMSFDEKSKYPQQEANIRSLVSMVHGNTGSDFPYVGNVLAIPRLNIPKLNLEDGPQVRESITTSNC
jgi:hypothetical protein